MRLYVYDVETPPNIFMCSFKDYKTKQDTTFVIDDDSRENDRDRLISFIKGSTLVGYNNATFDDLLLNCVIMHKDVTALHLHKMANRIISGQRDEDFNLYKEFRPYLRSDLYESIDLIRLLFSKKLRVGLKELECSLQHPNVSEFEHPFDKILTSSEKISLKDYNLNDISATDLVLDKSIDALKLRRWAEKEYDIKGYSMDGVSLGANILAKEYEKVVGNKEFLNQKTVREWVHVNDIILPVVKFETREFQEVLERYKAHTWYSKHYDEQLFEDSGLKFEPLINGHRFKFSLGGLHHETRSGIWESDDDYTIYSIDAASYYPSMTISWLWCPEHLDSKIFIPIYTGIRDKRIVAKKDDPLKADTLKLSLNATFGNYGNFYSWLFDHRVRLQICCNGQLLLAMFCEQLFKHKIELIDANTDGIFLRVHKSKEGVLDEIINWWQNISKVMLEKVRFEKMWFVNTADYFGTYMEYDKKLGEMVLKVKEKGMFQSKVTLGKGMEFPIIAKSIKSYFLDGIPFEQTIRSCQEIFQFCSYKKLGRDAECWHNQRKVQRTNRYYAAKGGAYLFRRSFSEKKQKWENIHLLKESPVILLNKLDEKPMAERNINYGFYTSNARSLVHAIKGQEGLF